ncbi:MAG: hypothetical protein ACHQZR_01580 [Candidatus Limnocylindrales bacterium]
MTRAARAGIPIARAAVAAGAGPVPVMARAGGGDRDARPARATTGRGARTSDTATELAAIRRLARDLDVETGDLLAVTLLHEASHRLLDHEAIDAGTHPIEAARHRLRRSPDAPDLTGTLRAFRPAYPAEPALPDRAADLDPPPQPRTRDGRDLEELVLLRLNATNPALAGAHALFDDAPLAETSDYLRLLALLDRPAAARPPTPGAGRSTSPSATTSQLMARLRAPIAAAPGSLAEQLRWVARHWSAVLTPDLRRRLTMALDLLAEEAHARELRDATAHGPGGLPEAPELGSADAAARFSSDAPWMSNVVLLAKNAYVWLERLARDHQRPITTLDDVPEVELAGLAAAGINGLWLIGLWERSRASRAIKQRMGNPDAAASAYAIDRYVIAADLGGDAALEVLRARAARHGIRLASDMVPNHMGLDSDWVLHRPDRFIGLDEPPFPGYRFTGPDLSPDPAVGIRLEDGYWDRSDAAVVFQREDLASGAVRYLYHGNDGTETPWNDTAQLDYLQAEVREAVIGLILDVARRFPIIRFDAAMTLARRHIQRLWYPPPGHGGAIPSRAEHGRLSPSTFRRRMPHEFWRDVVDSVAREAPDTLLLAEAFWLMEGYFVRTLGMHRVYNSAFMHMLRDEHNTDYQAILRETVAFDPRVLERYVNFMSNPDERSAADQFGTGGKYAGVATLLATLPGLPLLAHGQLEGFHERYGMEFRRAQLDERPDPALAALHEARVFPLLRRRAQFASALTFRLFEVVTDDGQVLPDVFAYTNRADGARSLVLYHNRWGDAVGRLRRSTAFATGRDDEPLRSETLVEALDLATGDDTWYTAHDLVSGRDLLFHGPGLARDGLAVRLDAFGCRVLLDWRALPQDEPWAELAGRVGPDGTPDLALALDALRGQRTDQPAPPPTGGEVADRADRAAPADGDAPRGIIEPT